MGKFYLRSAASVCCSWLAVSLFYAICVASGQSVGNKVVCSSLDIRNLGKKFKLLENCTIIEGSLQIVLMKKLKTGYFDNLSFPKLVEITDYLLFYDVVDLISIGKLFPNLAIIRGNKLIYNYALSVFDMPHLMEIGLGNLTDITRGSVRIEKNPYLCYVHSIDWDLIAKSGKKGHFFQDNQDSEDCPNICLHSDDQNLCPYSEEKQIHLCWNRYSCQKVCSRKCSDKTCANPTGCCHPQCLSGCTGSEATDCVACRNVGYKGKCLENCPSSTYRYNSRCITEEECKSLKGPKDAADTFFKLWRGKNQASGDCILECPLGYMAMGKHGCRRCEKSCPKVCPESSVENLAAAQKLLGCTTINGSLTIKFSGQGENIYQEMEKFLGKIEVITGFLKIYHSLPFISLNFLSNLTLIKGDKLERDYYSFILRGNENLQKLWDWSASTGKKQKLIVRRGKPFIHRNPKLCYDVINDTLKNIGFSSWTSVDASRDSNGEKGACEHVTMKLSTDRISHDSAILMFDDFSEMGVDYRTILSYIISYRQVKPNQKVSLYEGRDACSDGSWKVLDVDAAAVTVYGEKGSHMIQEILYGLTPDTHYAVHVRASVISIEKTSGFSDIIYFKTEPSDPSKPVDLRASEVSTYSIHLKWKQPEKPNGKVTHYKIEWSEESIDLGDVYRKHFCQDFSITSKQKKKKPKKMQVDVKPAMKNVTLPNKVCICPKAKKKDEDDIKNQISFENYLQNLAYVRVETRKKRSLEEESFLENQISTSRRPISLQSSLAPSAVSNTITEKIEIVQWITNDTIFVVPNLAHYTRYHIMVKACHDFDIENKTQRCSPISDIYRRTKPLTNADDINLKSFQSRVDNHTSGLVYIKWKPPQYPNGIINGYQIEYKRVDIENFKQITVCIPDQKFRKEKGHALKGLQPGKYSMRLQAISLAGNGAWTGYKYFEIQENETGLATHVVVISVIIPLLIFMVLISFGTYCYFKRKYNKDRAASSLFTSVNPEYVSTFEAYIPDDWEFPRENVTLLQELGQGTFGMVYEGKAKDPKSGIEFKCAVKTANKTATVREFLQEASVMKAFVCHHVVRLKGIVSILQPTLVIMELMEYGDLRSYLRNHRPDNELQTSDGGSKSPPSGARFIQMAAEIADGMDYLAFNKFVHRDLAARNCMVGEDLTVKIGDFGMTRDIYETDYYRKGGRGMLPVRWMAPESLKDGVFTSQSDVWSYGVVLWEMVTLACQPYQGLANEQVLKYVIEGGVIEAPVNCDIKLYEIMRSCWLYNPKLRPTFTKLVESSLGGVSDTFKELAFYYNRNVKHENSESDDEEFISPSTPLHSNVNENGSVGSATTSSQRTCEPKRMRGSSSAAKKSKDNNHSSNGYVPCDSTGSTYC